MSEYTANIENKNHADAGQIAFGEVSQLDVLRQLAARDGVAGDTYIINRFEGGRCIRREVWSPAEITEYLALIAKQARSHSPFAPLPMPTTESDNG